MHAGIRILEAYSKPGLYSLCEAQIPHPNIKRGN
jgi:hypothetical protein